MASNNTEYDVESPKSVDLSQAASKEDDVSVDTHQSDSESDTDSHHYGQSRSRRSYLKLMLVAVLAAVLGLAVGLGLGLTVGQEEAATRSVAAPASDEAQSTVSESAAVNEEPIASMEEETVDFEEEPVEVDSKPPAFGGVVGMGSPSETTIAWPQLLGLPAEEAKKILEDLDEGYTVVIVPPSGVTTKDLRTDRIFLFTNEEGYVARVPRPGR